MAGIRSFGRWFGNLNRRPQNYDPAAGMTLRRSSAWAPASLTGLAVWMRDSGTYQNGTGAYIVHNGDSLTAGTGSTGGNNYPNQLATMLGLASPVPGAQNISAPGLTIASMNASGAGSVDTLYAGAAGKTRAVILWGGINDCAAGTSAVDIYNLIVDYCQDRKAVGWKVVVSTLTPAGTLTAPQEVVRQAVNALLVADFPTVVSGQTRSGGIYAEYLVDNASDPRIQNTADTGVYADTIHFTNTGYGYIAANFKVAANLLGIGGRGAETTPAATNNDPIGRWLDQSSDLRLFGSVLDAYRPLLKTYEQNGRAMLLFDGSDDRLQLASNYTIGTSYTIFAVVRPSAIASLGVILGAASPGLYALAADATNLYSWDYDSAIVSAAHGGLSNGTTYLLCVRRSGTGVKFYKDGTQVGGDKTLGGNNAMVLGDVGARYDGILPFGGHIGEVIGYSSALSDADHAMVELYAMGRWGL